MTAEEKLKKLKQFLKEMGSLVLAYSGGVDSTFLLKVAADTLKDRVLAVTAKSPTYPEQEYINAMKIAQGFEVKFLSIFTDEFLQLEFVHNSPDRCYYCKQQLFTRLKEIARRENLKWVADGSNFDDRTDFRPGRKAAAELGVRSPLDEVRLTKEEIRMLSRELGLPTWDKPSLACLASRVPYGVSLTREILERINQAEEFMRSMGLGQVRVRHHEEIARIEVQPADMEKVIYHREKIGAKLKALGYTYIVLDLEGYRPGSLNLVLN